MDTSGRMSLYEDYVSFETAKLLVKKGFDPIWIPGSKCTIQMAMKWLREKHNINPVPYALSLGWAFDVFDLSNRDITGCKKFYSMDFPSESEVYSTYEEACEAAIKYCLKNLI